MRADAMAFFGLPGQPPKITASMDIDLAHVTCAPPWTENTYQLLAATNAFKRSLANSATSARVGIFMECKDDLVIAKGFTALILGLQNLPEGADLAQLKEAGIRVISLAYDDTNAYGGGCLNMHVGLTEAGKQAIRRMADLGLILDLSHASHRMAREALDLIEDERIEISAMASHSGCYGIYPHFRNLPDSTLKAIADRGGVIGLPALGFLLGNGKDDMCAFRAHMRHAIDICGADAIVIGSDVSYVMPDPDEALAQFKQMQKAIDPHGTWGSRYPECPQHFMGPRKLPNIAGTIADIAKDKTDAIMGDNLLRFFKAALPK